MLTGTPAAMATFCGRELKLRRGGGGLRGRCSCVFGAMPTSPRRPTGKLLPTSVGSGVPDAPLAGG